MGRADTHHNPEALEYMMKRNLWKQVTQFLKTLPRMEKEVFMLRFMDHLTIKEIATALKKSESTVKTHLYRSVDKLKKESALIHLMEE